MTVATALRPDPLAALIAAVGRAAVSDDPADLAVAAQDVHTTGPTPLAVFRPADIAMLARGLAASAGLAIVPRGGGMSYTSGGVADAPGALVVDLGAMNRILAVDPVDMTVTVEAGCTWAALYADLHPRGLRTPLWGTLSGRHATVGGGMSANGVFWGGGRGSIAPTMLAAEVVLADGRIVATGSGFFRPFGPDATGLFAADNGAFGIKAHITLPLVPEAAALAYGSFAFDTADAAFAAMSGVARAGLASESFGFDPFLQAQRMKRDSVASDARALGTMMRAQGSAWAGLKAGARVVAAGRSFLDDARFSAHFICEGRSAASADDDLRAVRSIVAASGGREVANTIPQVLRANPFPPVNSMLGPSGERWVPVHGIVRHSRAVPVFAAVMALFATHRAAMDRLEVGAGAMFVACGATGFLIEPVFYWPDATAEIHRRSVEPAHLARLTAFPPNPAARTLVDTLRAAIVAIFGDHGGVHFQLGRLYPLQGRSDPVVWDVLTAVKAVVDPDGRMNPGVLCL